jgi:hypothetical protein
MRILRRIAPGLALSAIFFSTSAWACPSCRPAVESGVYNQNFVANLLLLLLPLAVLGAIGIGIHFSDAIIAQFRLARTKKDKGTKPWQAPYSAGR